MRRHFQSRKVEQLFTQVNTISTVTSGVTPNNLQKLAMKSFQSFRKYLAILGIEPLQPFQKNHSMIMQLKRLVVFIIFNLFVILLLVFVGCEADSLDEYADAFYMSATLTTMLFVFTIFLWKMDILFKLIGDFEELIQKRKIWLLLTVLFNLFGIYKSKYALEQKRRIIHSKISKCDFSTLKTK